MDVEIGEVSSTVRSVDSQALLNPQVLEQIVRQVLRRVRENQAHDRRTQDERRLERGVSEPEEMGGD